jgi:hypothetical protein
VGHAWFMCNPVLATRGMCADDNTHMCADDNTQPWSLPESDQAWLERRRRTRLASQRSLE